MTTVVLGGLAAWLSLLMFAERAHAIPVFARKYATSCITCHTIYPKLNDVGEAFRRNGYQFPANDDVLVKEEPIKLGTDAYKEMFPNSIWPSTLPSIPPVSIFTLSQNVVNLSPHGQLKTWDFAFPSDVEIIGVGALGNNISGFYDVAFSPSAGASVGRSGTNAYTWPFGPTALLNNLVKYPVPGRSSATLPPDFTPRKASVSASATSIRLSIEPPAFMAVALPSHAAVCE